MGRDEELLGAGGQLLAVRGQPDAQNGALSLNVKSGSTCQSTSGAADYKNEIIGPPNGSAVCDVSLGDVLPVKTAQNTGPTAQGIDKRITSWDPLTAIVQLTANGQANILKPNSPQLVLLPVVEDMSGDSTWPSGSGTVRVIGFAYFVLTEPGYTNGGKTVLGTIVGLACPHVRLQRPAPGQRRTRSRPESVYLQAIALDQEPEGEEFVPLDLVRQAMEFKDEPSSCPWSSKR